MEEPEDNNVDNSNNKSEGHVDVRRHKSDKTLSASKNKVDEDEATISEASISEHITSNDGSLENDRSLQEIEIPIQPSALIDFSSEEEHISQEQRPNSLLINSLPSSLHSNVSNGLSDNSLKPSFGNEGTKNAKSILVDILGDSKFISEIENSKEESCKGNSKFISEIENSNSKEESFNLFANVDFSDKSLINLPSNNDVSLNEKNLFASNFDLPLDLSEGHISEKNIGDIEKIKKK